MSNYPSPLITDRWAEFEKRLARLEAVLGSGVLGTDQTIKGSHDRLDALLGAGGQPSGVVLATITKTGIADNTATAIFTVTTTNEAGSNDGGAWVADLLILAGVDIASNSGQGAARAQRALVTHALTDIGSVDTAVDTLHTGTTADAYGGGLATIDTITVTAVETSAYVTTIKLTIDVSGFFSNCQAAVLVTLRWMGFLTAPVVAAA